ncbi:MAG: DUF2764 family protein [Rikenellaceae bacterium]|nr:DUF2764 family protein [Rikenellaceae bacterium]
MKNYEFIIAGLPYLEPDFDNPSMDYDSLSAQILSYLDKRDRRYIDWLRFGLIPDNLSPHFYRTVAKNSNRFLRTYFAFDLMLRNIQATYLSIKQGLEPDKYLIGDSEIVEALKKNKTPDFGITSEIEFASRLLQIFEIKDLIEREKALDVLRWEEVNKICTFSYFNIDVILSFIFKTSILKRWHSLDKVNGALLFRKYVDEMRNSYKTIKE